MLARVNTSNAQVQCSVVLVCTRHVIARSRIASPVETRHCQTLTRMAPQFQDVCSVRWVCWVHQTWNVLHPGSNRSCRVWTVKNCRENCLLLVFCGKVLAQMGNFRTQQPAVSAWGTELWATQERMAVCFTVQKYIIHICIIVYSCTYVYVVCTYIVLHICIFNYIYIPMYTRVGNHSYSIFYAYTDIHIYSHFGWILIDFYNSAAWFSLSKVFDHVWNSAVLCGQQKWGTVSFCIELALSNGLSSVWLSVW